jgi:multicomponent Na+:H+ antiporter subunit B
MPSILLRATASPLAWLLGLFSVIALFRGHDEPGGGFVGGLLLAAAFALHATAFGTAATRKALRFDPRAVMAAGVAAIFLAAVIPLLCGDTLLEAQWWLTIPGITKLGTVFLFDAGVYLTVCGTALLILLTLAEE